MIPVRSALPLLFFATTFACRSAETPRAAEPEPEPDSAPSSASGIELFVPPAQGLHVESDVHLGALLASYADLMGWRLTASDQVGRALADARCWLDKSLDVPASEVHTFVEGALRPRGFVLRFAHAAEPVVLEVGSLEIPSSLPPPNLAPLVEVKELARWAEHPCFLVQTRLHLPGVDVQGQKDPLRRLFPSFPPEPLVPLAGGQVLLRGYGADLARLVQVFRALADKTAAANVASPSNAGDTDLLKLLAPPTKPLHLEKTGTEDFKLRNLVGAYTQLMGWRTLISQDTANQLKILRFDLALPLDVAPENVHAFVESVLKASGFVLSFAHAQEPVLLQVDSMYVAGQGRLSENAVLVPAADLPRWASHPDFLVTTCLVLPGIDVRTFSNSLRLMLNDPQTQQVIPVGNTNGLIVTGFASDVVAMTRMFHALTGSAADKPIAAPALLPGKSLADLLVIPAGALHLTGDVRGLTLEQLVRAYAQLTGWRVLAAPDTMNQLKTLQFRFESPLDIPPENVHAFVEGVLRENDFVLHFAHAAEPVLLAIESTNVAGRGNPRASALIIPEAELPRWAEHSAFLVSTCIDLSGIDVRTLSNSLRQMFSDQQTQQIIPVGNTDSLIVTGFGTDVADLTAMLRSLQSPATGAHPAPPALAPSATGIELLVPPARSLHIEKSENKRFKLRELLARYIDVLGWRLLADADTDNQLRTLDAGIGLPLDVPPESVHAFVESIARANDLVFSFVHECEPVVLGVKSRFERGGNATHRDAKFVPVSELPRWAGHASFMIETCVDLPGVDVPKLVNSLRPRFNEQQTQRIVPMGNSNALLVSGYAPDVVDTVSWIVALGSGTPAPQLPVLPMPAGPDRERLFPEGTESLILDASAERDGDPFVALEAFGKWSNRPVQITDAARAALQRLERKPLEQHVWVAPLVHSYVGVLLRRGGCTLLPVPPAAPVVWAVDVQQAPPDHAPESWPEIPIGELTSWGAYCATPFRAQLHVDGSNDASRLVRALQLLDSTRSRGEMIDKSEVVLWGTPDEIQAAAGIVRAACESLPSPR